MLRMTQPVRVLPTPVRVPRGNAICERFGGSLRRECLDLRILLNERHLKMTLRLWCGSSHRQRISRATGYRRARDSQPGDPWGGLHHEDDLASQHPRNDIFADHNPILPAESWISGLRLVYTGR